MESFRDLFVILGFKPCYKWNTFNTTGIASEVVKEFDVLNLVISGIPSILMTRSKFLQYPFKF